jgi:hypothetical protein
MPSLFFADLVREHCHEGGGGALTPAGALPGHRAFAGTVPAETPFHYAIAGIAFAGEWEVGTGRIDGAGRLVRESVAASSNGGAAVDFTPGLKTLALTVGAGWFAACDAGATAIEAALGGKQPVSTAHAGAANGAAGDLITVRRGEGWVNIPIASFAYQGADGAVTAGGPLTCPAGSAAAPAMSFAADANTGLFSAAADAIGFALGGTERARLTATGLGLGTSMPYARIELVAAASAAGLALGASAGASNLGLELYGLMDSLPPAQTRGFVGIGNSGVGVAGDLLLAPRSSTSSSIRFLTGSAGAVERWRITSAGTLQPGSDNGYDLGAASMRVRTIYAATGTINTSDARDKAWRGAPDAAERRAARRIAAELGFYQWLDAIAEKGAGAARLHFGVRAQAVWAIMADEGLVDPIGEDGAADTRYAFLCRDIWPGPDGPETRLGIREGQLALFLIAGQESRIALLEAAA